MTRQILDARPQIRELPDTPIVRIDADIPQVARERFLRIAPLEGMHHFREPVDLFRLEPEHLADLARRAPAAIRDDVGRHRRAQLSVAPVDVLNDLLAPVAARQIEIDVRPLAALLRQETLEEQLHPDRIDAVMPRL